MTDVDSVTDSNLSDNTKLQIDKTKMIAAESRPSPNLVDVFKMKKQSSSSESKTKTKVETLR